MYHKESKKKAKIEIEWFKNNLQGVKCLSRFASNTFNASKKKLKVDKDYNEFKKDMVGKVNKRVRIWR